MKQPSVRSFICVSLALLGSTPGWAGGEGSVGNGGHAVVCRDMSGAIRSIEILDYFEARIERDAVIDLGGPTASTDERVETFIQRIEKLDPARAQDYRRQAAAFPNEAKFLHGTDLQFIPDAASIILPRNCKLEQLAIQAEPNGMNITKRFTLNGDLWDAMDATQRAGIILHELIYREMLALGQKNSIAARYFNSTIASPQAAAIDKASFAQLLAKCGLPINEYHPDGTPRHLHHTFPAPRPLADGTQVWVWQEFYGDGFVDVTLGREATIQTSAGALWISPGNGLALHPNGQLRSIINRTGGTSSPIETKQGNLVYRFSSVEKLRFRSDGTLDFAEIFGTFPEELVSNLLEINTGKRPIEAGQCPFGAVYVKFQNHAARTPPRNLPPGYFDGELSWRSGYAEGSFSLNLETLNTTDLCLPLGTNLHVTAPKSGSFGPRASMSFSTPSVRHQLIEGKNSDSFPRSRDVYWNLYF